MIRPILACSDPYKTAEQFAAAGWNIDFSQPPESGDPLVGVSLFGNSVLLGVTDGYVADNHCRTNVHEENLIEGTISCYLKQRG